MFYIRQTSNHDCGYTCLKMLLANLYHDENYLFLQDPFVKNEDVSYFALINEAKKYDLILGAVRFNEKEDIIKIDNLPAVVTLKQYDINHAVYLYKVTDKYVYYFDPSSTKKKLAIKDFIALWDGTMLRIIDYTASKCSINKPSFINNGEVIMMLVLEIFSALSAVMGVYFLKGDSKKFLPLVFILITVIMEILIRKYMVFLMKRIDFRVFDNDDDVVDHRYYDFHNYYENYKKYLLVNYLKLFSSSFIIILITVILLLNNMYNLIYVGANLLLAIIYVFIKKPRFNKQEEEMAHKEERLKYIKDKSKAFDLMSEIRKNAYDYASNFTAIKFLIITFQIILAFLVMLLSQAFSFTYIICYLLLETYFYNSAVTLCSYQDDKAKQDNLLVKITSLLEKNSQ